MGVAVYCQWCGRARDELAIHHCGPSDRPPAYCMADGQPLAPGATVCAVCGLTAGEKPAPVPAGARTAEAQDSGPPVVAAAAAAGPGPSPSPQPGATARPATPLMAARAAPAHGGALRTCLVATSIAGVCSFFIPWFTTFGFTSVLGASFSVSGITGVEHSKWEWWTPPCPQLLLILFGMATLLSLLGWWSRSSTIDGVVTLVGAALTVLLVRWLWLLRSGYVTVTGFWLTVAAGILIMLLGVASLLIEQP